MGKFRVTLTDKAKKDFKKIYKSGSKLSIYKLERILIELSEHPRTGTGKPEQLKGNLNGVWSRRINKKDRLIYDIIDKEVLVDVISALGHYGDK